MWALHGDDSQPLDGVIPHGELPGAHLQLVVSVLQLPLQLPALTACQVKGEGPGADLALTALRRSAARVRLVAAQKEGCRGLILPVCKTSRVNSVPALPMTPSQCTCQCTASSALFLRNLLACIVFAQLAGLHYFSATVTAGLQRHKAIITWTMTPQMGA